MADTVTLLDALTKEKYIKGNELKNMMFKGDPFLQVIKVTNDFTGDLCKHPVIVGGTNKRSATYASAEANTGGVQSTAFHLTRVKDYVLMELDREASLALPNDMAAFKKSFEVEMDTGLQKLRNSISQSIMSAGNGVVGQISTDSTVASDTITLADTNDIVAFEVGDVIQLYTALTGGTVRSSGDTAEVTAVDYDLGTLSFAGNLTDEIAAAVAGDYIAMRGDYGNKITGVGAWLPSSAPSATSFFGVDRSTNPTRLGGIRVDGTGLSVVEAINRATVRVNRLGGSPDYLFVNHSVYEDIMNTLDASRHVYTDDKNGVIGFNYLYAKGIASDVKIVAHRYVPSNTGFLVQADTWNLRTLGGFPDVHRDDGTIWRLRDASDTLQARASVYGNVGCSAPGWNARITFA